MILYGGIVLGIGDLGIYNVRVFVFGKFTGKLGDIEDFEKGIIVL